MKKMIVTLIVIILIVVTPTFSKASTNLDPKEINVEITQGETLFKKVTLKNTGNQALNGSIEVLNVECGLDCPWAKLSVNRLNLMPNESKDIEIEIRSHLLNKIEKTTLSIRFYPNDNPRNYTEIDLNINVKLNYLLYLGLPICIISFIIIIILWKKRKSKQKET
jgi:uncharacterized membrane protein